MKMEALNSNLDCNLSTLARVSRFSSKKPFSSCRSFPRLNTWRNKNLGLNIVDHKKNGFKSDNNGCFIAVDEDLVKRVGRGLLGFAAAVSLCCDSPPAFAESLTVAFPVSHTREVNMFFFFCSLFYFLQFHVNKLVVKNQTRKLKISCVNRTVYLYLQVNTVQRTLVEAWGLIRETFIDPTFNHQGNNNTGFGASPD